MFARKKEGNKSPTQPPQPLAPITENPYKVVEFYNKWRKVIPEQFRAVACPEPTPEQYAAVKLEAGIRSGVKKFEKDQKAGKLSEMEKEALEGLVRKQDGKKGGNGGAKTTGLDANLAAVVNTTNENAKPASAIGGRKTIGLSQQAQLDATILTRPTENVDPTSTMGDFQEGGIAFADM
ncbi:hypothetical protein HJC23_013270 [Cyclotella cryptica]|uniref:Uncharacterized protein n=1 Tax=Cyclotella cryptica TaxID=29204 RepID=A0ABD3PFM1_9STRA|eukprot:CCRYP_014925-RA/>CCRYP_014925-RA protein AED:0.26 eAED:0.26 QI:0/-1/0/1/-1/1/1/0/178